MNYHETYLMSKPNVYATITANNTNRGNNVMEYVKPGE